MSIRAADCMTCLHPFLLLADRICRRKDAVVYRAGFPNKASSLGRDDGDEEVRKKIGGRPFLSCASSRSSECLGRIIMRSFLCSPLVVVGKGLKLISNRRVRHGSGTRSKVCAVSRYCLPRREFWNVMKPSHGSLAAG